MRWRGVNPHSYIGIQPARTGAKLTHTDQAVGIDHIARWARSRKEVDLFHRDFLTAAAVYVTDEPQGYPQYWPGYYAVFFDDPINGIHWELAWVPKVPTPRQVWSFIGHFGSSPEVGRTLRERCLVSPCKPGEACRVGDRPAARHPDRAQSRT